MQNLDAKVAALIHDLPDEQGARLFLERLATEQPRAYQKLLPDAALLSDTLALAAWSPLLATTLEQNPDYLPWLKRERADVRVRTREQLKESLGRFALTHSTLAPQVLFARFRRRELLRIYLHDVRRVQTLVETTEELSNLADAILDYAFSLARQELDNRYGVPLRDERGRIATAEFCVVALGKLGSAELNYASDIDLVFIYSDDGTTAGGSSERGKLTNREYFIKLSEAIGKLVGQPAGEGAAYRVDLRLRPHGRDGALAVSLAEALAYYDKTAQAWERQALIRSRPAAGSGALFARFANAVQPSIYRSDVSVQDALASVRLAKQKIDRNVARSNAGFNVKLQRGGIREIEFIAQALQLAHGAHDEWLRVSHTLISLGRLADRELITEQERSELSDAYLFLRTLEHRLQMEHGLQTHTVPQTDAQRLVVARRMGFTGETMSALLKGFDQTLLLHATKVRNAYDRVFAEPIENLRSSPSALTNRPATLADTAGTENHLLQDAAHVFMLHLTQVERQTANVGSLARLLSESVAAAINPRRALILTTRVAASLGKSEGTAELTQNALTSLVQLCGSSEFFGEMLASYPALVATLGQGKARARRRDYRAQLRAAIEAEKSFPAELAALRREWSRLLIEIGAEDAAGKINLLESNQLQTELAISSINVAYLVARRELARRYGPLRGGPRLSVLALGRLASGGVDYGSDLDITFVYDSLVSSPSDSLTPDEAYGRLVELMITALSSVTREGYLYRVDLRLRPNGKNGPLVSSSEGFLDYVRQRSAIWEWLAYVKLRAVAGDLELGKMVETHARHAVHERARAIDSDELRQETRRVRERLEREKGGGHKEPRRGGLASAGNRIATKYSAGGMLDVYFAARYLQLRDEVPDEGDDRSTRATLARLETSGSLTVRDHEVLSSGYELLRAVDHQLRLIAGKVAALPSPDYPAYQEITERLGFASPVELSETLRERMCAIREAYERITS
ncbi:MAG: [glutamine synthetase] adenylyltransferase / [glutamine synthetase]-adenylyl-L-tyrosine [Pyrinomonadaceae bacterium]|nr:[glutamine synthetase] adenylyltransferase / [glutamine synthetase]-adenylyl-L-tyrosine [Pyrinomonadaceae bacterium]